MNPRQNAASRCLLLIVSTVCSSAILGVDAAALPPRAHMERAVSSSGRRTKRAVIAGLQVESQPWGKVKQWAMNASSGPHDGGNLCANGKLLPQLYIIGAAKSATTSLAIDLMGAGIESVGPDCRGWCTKATAGNTNVEKEFHFFDSRMDWRFPGKSGMSNSKKVWMGLMPKCPDAEGPTMVPKRRVLADFTPEYLRMTSLPSGATYGNDTMAYWLGLYPNPLKKKSTVEGRMKMNFAVPKALKHFYGDASRSVTFVVMLREPIARLRSLYDCCICPRDPKTGTPWAERCKATSFAQDLRKDMTALTSNPPVYSDWLWGAHYGQQLNEWLTYFEANQLYVVPFRVFTGGRIDSICGDLSKRLHFKMDCDSQGTKAAWLEQSHSMHNGAELAQGMDLRLAFDLVLSDELRKLYRSLATAYTKGAGLAGFVGKTGSETEIEGWLRNNW